MLKHLKEVYGYNNFRECQQDIIQDVIDKNNTIVVFPTGGGKSMCYQFPATYTNKLSIVISPLLSLMKDQQLQLEKLGIKSKCFNSINTSNINEILNYNVVYFTPEYFVIYMDSLKKIKDSICLFAIDEAHCMSSWGHDFRVSYKNLKLIPINFPSIPIMFLSATMTPEVSQDIFEIMDIDEANSYNLGTWRENLSIHVERKYGNIINSIKNNKINTDEPTVIYTQTRKEAIKVNDLLVKNGYNSEYYHAGLSTIEKEIIHKKFSKDETNILVATIAFGMGINKPNIRKIINWGTPSSIEDYYQQIGRAGRDGVLSKVIMYYNDGDFYINNFIIKKNNTNQDTKIKLLNEFKKYINNNSICRQVLIDYYFENGEINVEKMLGIKEKCGICDNCIRKDIKPSKKIDITDTSEIILDFVKSLPCSFGVSKLCKTLAGSKSKDLNDCLTNNIYYGKLKGFTNSDIKNIINILIDKGNLIRTKFECYNVISFGKDLSEKVYKEIYNTSVISNIDTKVFKFYKNIIDIISKTENITSYLILNDKVIENISIKKPKNIEELKLVDGINNTFIEKYQDCFLFYNNKKLSTYDETFIMYKLGKNIEEIATLKGVSTITIENHFIHLWKKYKNIDKEMCNLTLEIQNQILEIIDVVGTKKLKPIKELLPEHISYFQIKACVLLKEMKMI